MSHQWWVVLQGAVIAADVLLLVPLAVLLVEVLLAGIPVASAVVLAGERPALAVLIPAHNERDQVAATIASVRSQLTAADRLVVIADNCQDDTAQVARAAGAQVIERCDPLERGKGFALAFGVRYLTADPPAVLLIVDADCLVSPGSIDALARVCAREVRPVQALYLMRAPEDAGALQRLMQFAWRLRNEVRPRGLQRLGLPCHLMGSGMAFPWHTLSAGQLATGHLVEDLKLGIELAEAGTPPRWCPEALVTSVFPGNREGLRTQRTRWEHGHLSVLLTAVPGLLAQAVRQRSVDLLALALDLLVPPLALLLLLCAAVWVAALLLAVLGGAWFALAFSSGVLLLMALAVILAWVRYGRSILSLRALALAGFYALGKLPLYLRFVTARQASWVRSRRDTETRPPL